MMNRPASGLPSTARFTAPSMPGTMAEVPISETRPRLFHVRQQEGRLEVDILVELGGGRLIAIEVKADAAPTAAAARHLTTMRDRFTGEFVAGIVLHTGPRTYTLSDRIVAAPISTLWAD